jgi:hypothetical protein
MRSLRTTVTTLLGISTLALSALVITGTAAMAHPAAPAAVAPLACTHPGWSDKDKESSGSVADEFGYAEIHSGPNAGCTTVDYALSGEVLYYHCYVFNSAGNTWTHLRIDGTSIEGWVWDDYLDDGGSLYKC